MILAGAAILAAACAGKPSATTTIIGQYDNKLPNDVHIVLSDKIDTTIVVDPQTHSFKLEVPTDYLAMLSIESEDHSAMVIPDGTTLRIHFGDEYQVEVSSDKPRISVQKRFDDYSVWMQNFLEEYRQESSAVENNPAYGDAEREGRTKEVYEKAVQKLNSHNREVIAKNRDNLLSIVALSNLEISDDELVEVIAGLSEEIQELPDIRQMKEALEIRSATSEGKMFKDFTVLQDPEDPSSEVKLSDYVGKGKYVIVDFWASWCGPCKAELPNLKEVYEKYHGDKFDMLSVAVWDRPEATKAAAAELGITWNQIFNAQRIPTELYGIDGIPHIILFSPDGTILKRNLRGEEIGKAVAEALK